jgi:hypothetical protein
MSYSVSNLFRDVAKEKLEEKKRSETLVNPDLPVMSKTSTMSIPYFRNRAWNAMRLKSYPTNGMAFLPRNTVFTDPRRDNFMMDGAIDPQIIRNQTDPINEGPVYYNESSLMGGSDQSMENETDSMELIRKAREGYYNYANRLNVMSQPPTFPTQLSQLSQSIKPQFASKIGYVAPINNPIYDMTGKTTDIHAPVVRNDESNYNKIGDRGAIG